MFLTKSRKANLDTGDAAAQARAAGKAARVAAQNAAAAARAAAAAAQVAAQNAARKSQTAAQNATVAAQNAAQKSQAAAQVAAQIAAQRSTVAAQNAGSSAQTTTAAVSKQVQQGVFSARKWAAPKLESVADYTATTVAPTVSSALRNTAAQVRPAEPASPAKRRMTAALTWSLLGAAVVAAAGAVAALARYRSRTAAANVDSELSDSARDDTATTAVGQPTGQTSAGPMPAASKPQPKSAESPVPAAKASPSASANQTETVTDASVNGHANTSGW